MAETSIEKKQQEYYDRTKSWKEAHKVVEFINIDARELQKALDTVAKLAPRLKQRFITLFSTLPAVDSAQINGTPLSEGNLWYNMWRYVGRQAQGDDRLFFSPILRHGLARDIHLALDFTKAVEEACKYAFKMEKLAKPSVESIT